MASLQFAAKSRALTARTVHLKLFPAPRNFNDQREVLRVLERFGEVTMFKSLKYRTIAPANQSFLATFANEQAVKEVMESAPIRYHLVSNLNVDSAEATQNESSESTEATTISPSLQSPAFADTETNNSTNPFADTNQQETSSSQNPSEFELHVHPSTLSHEKYIISPHTNPLYGPYKPAQVKKSYMANMLDKAVTSGMWSAGLRDWETDVDRWEKSNSYGYNGQTADARYADEDGLRGKILGRVGEARMGFAGSDSAGWNGSREPQRGMTERAVYIRGVNRRRKEIPEVMWGVRRFWERRNLEGKGEGRRSG